MPHVLSTCSAHGAAGTCCRFSASLSHTSGAMRAFFSFGRAYLRDGQFRRLCEFSERRVLFPTCVTCPIRSGGKKVSLGKQGIEVALTRNEFCASLERWDPRAEIEEYRRE